MEEKFKVKIKGTVPLLMQSPQSMIQDRIDGKNTKRGREEITIEEEAKRCLYTDSSGNIIVPSLCLLASIKSAAVNRLVPGKGKKTYKNYIYSGIRISPVNIPLQTSNGWEVDLKSVVIGSARIVKARPRFDDWSLEFDLSIVDPVIVSSALKEIIIDAGKYNGLLDFRPLFGLFSVETFEKIKK